MKNKNIFYNKDAKKIAKVALDWFKNGHRDFSNDIKMLAAYAYDYKSLMIIAQNIEAYANDESYLSRLDIGSHMRALDTIVRDMIPNTVYSKYND